MDTGYLDQMKNKVTETSQQYLLIALSVKVSLKGHGVAEWIKDKTKN